MDSIKDNEQEAARRLHEDRVSENVARIHKQMTGLLWVLFHARDYMLGVLQLLESKHLLRDLVQEEKDAESHKAMLRAFGPARTPREKGYERLCYAARPALPESFGKAVDALKDVRTDEELKAAEVLTRLDVHAWRHGGSTEDAIALARVRKLVFNLGRNRKTVPMDALREALGLKDDDR